MDSEPTQNDTLSKRVRYFRKVFAIGIGRRASPMQAAAILRAAMLSAEAERALLDPSISLNDKTRVDGAAARARRDMERVLAAHKSAHAAPPSLAEYLASVHAKAVAEGAE